jgi:Holliday junction DNA helicase RuvA
MISALTGELLNVDHDRARLLVGPMLFELLIPAADIPGLSANIGREITLHTILDFEGDASRGSLSPRLIGFLRPDDKRFFELFTTVKGIGPKKALRALSVPVDRIARAIESRNARELAALEGIGKRMAEQIVAELAGKAESFVSGETYPLAASRTPAEEQAILVCVRLGIARADAERLLEKVKHEQPELATAENLSRQMLRLRSASA